MAMGGPRIWWVVCLSLILRFLAIPDSQNPFLSRFPDPGCGVSVGCIDFSLMPESRVAGKAARGKGEKRKREKGELRKGQ